MMNELTVNDVYQKNEKVHEKFSALVATLDAERGPSKDSDNWSFAQLVEHVALVEDGMSRICAKLLAKAEADGKLADGPLEISPEFIAKSEEIADVKLEAPERVRPAGERSVADSLALIDESRKRFEDMRPLFEKYDAAANKFPHPYFGEISAAEWLVLAGGHKARHLRQLIKMIEKSEADRGQELPDA